MKKQYLKEFRFSETKARNSWIFAELSDFLEVGDELHGKIAFPLSSDLAQEVCIAGQVLVREVVLNLKNVIEQFRLCLTV